MPVMRLPRREIRWQRIVFIRRIGTKGEPLTNHLSIPRLARSRVRMAGGRPWVSFLNHPMEPKRVALILNTGVRGCRDGTVSPMSGAEVRSQVLGNVESSMGADDSKFYPRGNQKLARGPLRHPGPGRLASAPRLPTQVVEAWFAGFCCSRFAATKVFLDPFQWFEKSWIELRHMVF